MTDKYQPRMSPGMKENLDLLHELSGQERPKVMDKLFLHVTPTVQQCEHDFQGWREFADSTGGEQVCTKCGVGALAHSLSLDF